MEQYLYQRKFSQKSLVPHSHLILYKEGKPVCAFYAKKVKPGKNRTFLKSIDYTRDKYL